MSKIDIYDLKIVLIQICKLSNTHKSGLEKETNDIIRKMFIAQN